MLAVCAFLLGLIVLAVGVALVYLPAGVIAAGLALVGVAVLHERGRIRAARRNR